MSEQVQPTINMGIVGHVDHGKTTLTKLISGKWTDTHSEEIKRGITIKLGYSVFSVYYDEKEKRYKTKKENSNCKFIKKISIVDAPGHESLISTMISGAAIMDCALLIIAADEKCPQPQTREHLKTLEIAGIKDVIIVQNKIDLVTKERAIEHFHEIKNFVKGTIAEDSPIIPISAEYGANLDVLLEYIAKQFKERRVEKDDKTLMFIIRSFDVNKPGTSIKNIKGGIIGGSLKSGVLKVGDEIEIRPGRAELREGKEIWKPIYTKINSIKSENISLETARPGGSIAISTDLDPYLTKSDKLVGHIVGKKGTLPEPLHQLTFENHLFDKVMGSEEEHEVKPIYNKEILMLIVNSLKTVGIVTKTNPKETTVVLKKPVMAFDDDKIVLFRRFQGNKWHIIGHGIVKIN